MPSPASGAIGRWVLISCLTAGGWGFVCSAYAEEGVEAAPVETEVVVEAPVEPPSTGDQDQPIAVELTEGIQALHEQIAEQQELLATAQTEHERQLIQNHIRLQQKEQRSLEGVLHKLVGPNYEPARSFRSAERPAE